MILFHRAKLILIHGACTQCDIIFRNLHSMFGDLLVLVSVLTLWSCVRSFSFVVQNCIKKCESEDDVNHDLHTEWIKIIQYYKTLHNVSTLINKSFGMPLGLVLISFILYSSTRFHEVFIMQVKTDWTSAIRMLFFFVDITAILLFSANIVSKMGVLHDLFRVCKPTKMPLVNLDGKCKWCALKHGNYLPFEEVQMVVNDLATNSVAMKAADIFPVTYSLVANVNLIYYLIIKPEFLL